MKHPFTSLILLFFLANTNAQSLDWVKTMGGQGGEIGFDITTDASGNVITIGRFDDAGDFDPGPGTFTLPSGFSNDIFISKVDKNGNFKWARSMGTYNEDDARAVAVDLAGNIYTTGNFIGSGDFDPGPGIVNLGSSGSSDIYISKLDSNGNFVWAKSMGGTGQDYARGIDIDANGSVFITGVFSGTADFDPSSLIQSMASDGLTDIFIAKYSSSGNYTWARRIGGTSYDYGYALELTTTGDPVITGSFSSSCDFDMGSGVTTLTPVGAYDVYICKYNSNGTFGWAKSMGSTDTDGGNGLDIDSNNNIYLVGTFRLTMDFNPGSGTANLTAQSSDAYVAKYDLNGNYLWAKRFGSAAIDFGHDVSVDLAGNVCVAGSFSNTVDFDPGAGIITYTAVGQTDAFMLRLSSAGNFLFAHVMGSSSYEDCYGIHSMPNGDFVATGTYEGYVDINPDPQVVMYLNWSGMKDVFVYRFTACTNTSSSISITSCGPYTSPSGNNVWTGNGTYTDVIPNAGGCDSTITISLTVINLDNTVQNAPPYLISNQSGVNYQWVDCSNFSPINGGYYQNFEPTYNGSYAVIVSLLGCIDTSACVTVTTVGQDPVVDTPKLTLYPNPARTELHVVVQGVTEVSLMDLAGKTLMSHKVDSECILDLSVLPPGMYFMKDLFTGEVARFSKI